MACVLVVDDEPLIRDLVAECLRDDGYEVATAADGREALDRIAAHPPALLVLDIMMPVLDGLGVLRALAGAAFPVVVMSADAGARRAAGLMAVAAVLPKPFDLDDLSALAARLVAGPPGA